MKYTMQALFPSMLQQKLTSLSVQLLWVRVSDTSTNLNLGDSLRH